MTMRVIVCGGREYYDIKRMRQVLDEIHASTPIDEVVHGGALGADTLAHGWALRKEITIIVVPAKWSEGHKAGPLRNQRIVDVWGGNLCVAFPGGNGTADMVKRCERAGIDVLKVT